MVLWEVEGQAEPSSWCGFSFCAHTTGAPPATHLVQGQHHERSSAAGVHNHGHEFGVNGAEVAVPCHLRDSDVIVALVSFHSLAKDVTELAGSHNLPGHGELERKQGLIWGQDLSEEGRLSVCMKPVGKPETVSNSGNRSLVLKVSIWTHVRPMVLRVTCSNSLYVYAFGFHADINWQTECWQHSWKTRRRKAKKKKRKQNCCYFLSPVCDS